MPAAMPPYSSPPVIEARRPAGSGYEPGVLLHQTPQQPAQVPRADIVVEVFGNLPLQDKLEDLSRRLGRRQITRGPYRFYPPTILELITLVHRNPERPHDKAWNSIMALNLRYDAGTGLVTVAYCVEHCEHDPHTGAFSPKRRMVSYSAPEEQVVAKVNKKLGDLAKYADR